MKVKVVILTELISPYRIPVFNALSKFENIDLHVIFLAETDTQLREWLIYKDEIQFSYRVLSSFRKRFKKYNLLLNWGLGDALRAAEPNLIICGGYNYVASWQALYWAGLNHVRFLLWIESHGGDARRKTWLIEMLKKHFIRSCDGFVVPGRQSAQYLLHFDANPGKIFTAPNAVDNGFFETAALKVRGDPMQYRRKLALPERFFLFVGRLVHEKGVFDLMRAYGDLDPDLRNAVGLVFAGNGKARPELERMAARITPGSIHFPGFVQRDDLPQYYALADALILPTHSDTWGLVVNEAMACGLRVVCSDVAGCSVDLVEDGWNGFIVPAQDESQLKSALERMIRDSGETSKMAKNSSQRIMQFSPDICARGLAQACFAPPHA